MLAQPAHLHRRGPGSIACQPDRGRGIRAVSYTHLVIREEVLPGDAYRIGIGGAGVTGEEEEVPGDDMLSLIHI